MLISIAVPPFARFSANLVYGRFKRQEGDKLRKITRSNPASPPQDYALVVLFELKQYGPIMPTTACIKIMGLNCPNVWDLARIELDIIKLASVM